MAAEYIAQRGNLDIVLCERGIRTFETATRNTLDISAVPVAQRLSHLPVIVDPSHSGGRRDLVLPLTRAAIAVGADGVIIDVHPEPKMALCDGDQALVDSDIRQLASIAANLSPLMGRTLTPPLAAAPGTRGGQAAQPCGRLSAVGAATHDRRHTCIATPAAPRRSCRPAARRIGIGLAAAALASAAWLPGAAAASTGWQVAFQAHTGASTIFNGLVSVSASGKASAWAVGGTDLSGGTPGAPLAEQWNGTSWQAATLPSGLTGTLGAVSTPAPNDAWAVSQLTGYALHWDGTSWSVAKTWPEHQLATRDHRRHRVQPGRRLGVRWPRGLSRHRHLAPARDHLAQGHRAGRGHLHRERHLPVGHVGHRRGQRLAR